MSQSHVPYRLAIPLKSSTKDLNLDLHLSVVCYHILTPVLLSNYHTFDYCFVCAHQTPPLSLLLVSFCLFPYNLLSDNLFYYVCNRSKNVRVRICTLHDTLSELVFIPSSTLSQMLLPQDIVYLPVFISVYLFRHRTLCSKWDSNPHRIAPLGF